ncbi:signal recognition particle, SRP19 subunit [Dactylonectria estremocensis]|uniref:Signal recognition particle, SRP19 subunit n=1 Tax=Dactylonectria estremocensis TaxID=1079267 RepID=A0A9P9F588_9HYPO|nr:signal recognition particle, SRP19 subunit [Dactylonectria estremocensis]
MSHPRIEEVSDSDLDTDPEEADIDDFDDADIMRRVPDAAPAKPAAAASHILNPANVPQPQTSTLPQTADRSAYADFQCLYPVYFDAARSRAEGRRVPAELAVKDPLAREIANACSRLRLPTLFEPEKVHPKDWANPGRVKVGLKKAHGTPINNKHHLYRLVAEHLQENPTTADSPGLRVRIGGVLQPDPAKPYPKPAVPRGWKMGELVPYLSAAMTGGGVSENLFKDMMKEMQGGGDPMAALMGAQAAGAEESSSTGGGGKKKKEKKGKARA